MTPKINEKKYIFFSIFGVVYNFTLIFEINQFLHLCLEKKKKKNPKSITFSVKYYNGIIIIKNVI